jgi:hypothetical protein
MSQMIKSQSQSQRNKMNKNKKQKGVWINPVFPQADQ